MIAVIFYVGIKAQFKRVKTGKEALIGAKGIATTDLNPKEKFACSVSSGKPSLKKAQLLTVRAIEVVCMDGMFLVVKPTEQKA